MHVSLGYAAFAILGFVIGTFGLPDWVEYLDTICAPYNASMEAAGEEPRDLNIPCNVVHVIMNLCAYGDQFGDSTGNKSQRPLLSQQSCICDSQHWYEYEGCLDCFKAHGAPKAPKGFVAAVHEHLTLCTFPRQLLRLIYFRRSRRTAQLYSKPRRPFRPRFFRPGGHYNFFLRTC